MALSPSFTVNATPPIDPASIVLVDTSTGSDAAIASRQVLIYDINNTLIAPAQTWPYADASITLDLLDQDQALNIVVNWLDVGNTVLYTDSKIHAFVGYSEDFYYQLTQAQTSQPGITNDQDYYNNKIKLRVNIVDAQNAIDTGEDIYGAQGAIDRAIYMVQQHQLFFNV